MSRYEDRNIFEFSAFGIKYFMILDFMEEMGISNSNLPLMHPSPPSHLFRRQVFKVKKLVNQYCVLVILWNKKKNIQSIAATKNLL